MKVAFVSSEAVPYAKTGGLADVVGTLPQYLNKLGIEVAIFIPKYLGINGQLDQRIQIDMQGVHNIKIYREKNYYFVDYPKFFERDGLYGTEKGDFQDNCERFTLFCKAVGHLVAKNNFDIVHCHDWQAGLIPLYIKLSSLKTKSIFTIHNLGYQGKFPKTKFPILGIDEKFFSPEGIEFYGEINLLKAGILYSDMVTTVSENYAREIQSPELGFGLDGVLKKRSANLVGIINGIDYNLWNPQTDELIFEKYTNFKDKQKNKNDLLKCCNLDAHRPLIGIVSRIAAQKGFDILLRSLDRIIDIGYNLILLGLGEESYHKKLIEIERVYPDRLSINLKFDNKLAHRIYGGSDFFLMPSMYEPCGLGQLISLKYGTIPIVRKTGGLADTVHEFDPESLSGNGFLFERYTAQDLCEAVERAYRVYCDTELFKTLSENCMEYNYSWDESAKKYKNLYESILKS